MDVWQALALAVVQGVTEFLPISSSGHLVLMPQLFGWADQGINFDIAVHAGTLIAVLAYFRHDLIRIVVETLGSLAGRGHTEASRLGWAVVLATVPVGLAGLAFKALIEVHLRGAMVIALATILFGLVLGWADVSGEKRRDLSSLGWRDALLIGVAQAVALIPGTSRSGITMSAGLLLGFSREAAARFSFLLAIPTIALAGGLMLMEAWAQTDSVNWRALGIGVAASALTAYACIDAFLRFVARFSLSVFVLYRVLLGVVIIWLV